MGKKKARSTLSASTVNQRTPDTDAPSLAESAPSHDADGEPSRALVGKPCPSTTKAER